MHPDAFTGSFLTSPFWRVVVLDPKCFDVDSGIELLLGRLPLRILLKVTALLASRGGTFGERFGLVDGEVVFVVHFFALLVGGFGDDAAPFVHHQVSLREPSFRRVATAFVHLAADELGLRRFPKHVRGVCVGLSESVCVGALSAPLSKKFNCYPRSSTQGEHSHAVSSPDVCTSVLAASFSRKRYPKMCTRERQEE